MNIQIAALTLWVFGGLITVIYFRKNLKNQTYEAFNKMVDNRTPVTLNFALFILIILTVIFWPATWYGRLKK